MRSIKDQVPVDEKRWYAVKCKFRCERTLSQDLIRQDIETYVPIRKRIKQYASRKKKLTSALIPSYVFVKISRLDYLLILRHPHVYQFLNFSGQLSCIREEEMDIMKRVVGEVDDIKVENSVLHRGDVVQIIGGELTGLVGTIIESQHHNFKIELSSLGMGLCITVDSKFLMKTGSVHRDLLFDEKVSIKA